MTVWGIGWDISDHSATLYKVKLANTWINKREVNKAGKTEWKIKITKVQYGRCFGI